ncbi:MAG: V-type ATP synthase subunit A, partial [Promethearchaeota archaeon]
WYECRSQINNILSQENELKNIMQLIGEENLPEDQQLILFITNLIRNGYLIQNAFDSIDNFTSVQKLIGQIKLILLLYKEGKELLKSGYLIEDIKNLSVIDDILRISYSISNDEFYKIGNLKKRLLNEIESLKLSFGALKEI